MPPKEMDYQKEIERVDNLVEEIGEIAASDGEISKEEQPLLDNILDNLGKYRVLLIEVLEDDKLDLEEEQKLAEFRKSIIDDANKIATSDDRYTEDEWRIIEELKKFDQSTSEQ